MLYIAGKGNDRLTINQLAFFLVAAVADARGRALTISQIMEAGDGIINRSVANTYKVLLGPKERDDKSIGLGWLYREPDPLDERRKFLRLTEKGWTIVRTVLLTLGEAEEILGEG